MRPEQFQVMFDLERNNWWYRARRKIVSQWLDKFYAGRKDLKILDVGCGPGGMTKTLQKYGNVKGIDVSDFAINFCKTKGFNAVKGPVEKLPFGDSEFDLVGAFDVFYHVGIKDDLKAMRECARVCKTGGRIMITSAAFRFLLNVQDGADYTARRYAKKELKEKIEKAGFEVERISYAYFFVFPGTAVLRALKKWFRVKPKEDVYSDLAELPAPVNGILYAVMQVEAFLLRFVNLPFGVSVFCIARKK